MACPPAVAAGHIASFIDANLSAAQFAEYLTDPRRRLLAARHDGRIIGYAMLIHQAADDAAELSKLYVLADFHGTGVSATLMDAALDTAADWDVRQVWLGVNEHNQRAQRFYTKSGFAVTGTRTFWLGTHREHDFVMTRPLA